MSWLCCNAFGGLADKLALGFDVGFNVDCATMWVGSSTSLGSWSWLVGNVLGGLADELGLGFDVGFGVDVGVGFDVGVGVNCIVIGSGALVVHHPLDSRSPAGHQRSLAKEGWPSRLAAMATDAEATKHIA